MLIGYEIKAGKPAGYATVKESDGQLVNIEIVNCTIPNSNPDLWVATAWRLCKEHKLAGIILYHEGSTVMISEITPF